MALPSLRPSAAPPWTLVAAAAFLLGSLALGTGCSSSTGPDTPHPQVTFAPDVDTVRTDLGHTVNFSVTLTNVPDPRITFVREDLIVGTTANLPYQATELGVDRLRSIVTGAGQTWERSWIIVVGEVDRPPTVLNLALADGLTPSTVLVSWRRPADLTWPRPLVAYQVAARADTPPIEAGWAPFATIPLGGPAESREYGPTHNSLIVADAVLYFGIRTLDDQGALSPIAVAGPWRVTRAWEITGTLRDDEGQPLAGVSLDYGCETCRVFTGANGFFRLGPLREHDTIMLRTMAGAGYYEFLSPPVTIATAMPLSLGVIERATMSPGCAEAAYPGANGAFDLLLDLSKTAQTWDNRPDYTLLKWDSYPVAIYVPDGQVGSGGFELGAPVREAVASWNQRVGQPLLEIVTVPPALGIEVVFQSLAPTLGLAELVDPPRLALNEAVPRRVRVRVDLDLYSQELTRRVAMHEIGHALGLGGHSDCRSHLLSYESGPEITDDEVTAMLAVRNLPQATPMDRYLR